MKPRTQTPLNPQKENSQKISDRVSESISEKNIPETSQTQAPVLKTQIPEIEDAVSPSQEETQIRNTKSRDEYIITDIMNTFEVPLQDEDTIPANDMIPV